MLAWGRSSSQKKKVERMRDPKWVEELKFGVVMVDPPELDFSQDMKS